MINVGDLCQLLNDKTVYVVLKISTKRLIVKNPQGVLVNVLEQKYADLCNYDNKFETLKGVKLEMLSRY